MSSKKLEGEFTSAMNDCLASGASWPGAVAVSGGGDSIALMLLLCDWASASSRPLPVVLTVDHGLSPHSPDAARDVVARAKRLGMRAHKLLWRGPKPKSDIEAKSREARYRLMGDWCKAHGIKCGFLAHTLEDQAETLLLRLARGSGLDGLAAMRPLSPFPFPAYGDLNLVRPLLGIERGRLRAFLENRGEAWTEDPMNKDPRFARVRIRDAWPKLASLGLTPQRLALASRHLARARDALENATSELLRDACRSAGSGLLVDGARLGSAQPEIGLRALASVLARVSGESYRPRFERLESLYRSIREGNLKAARTLHGCRVGRAPKAEQVFGPFTLIVSREPTHRTQR